MPKITLKFKDNVLSDYHLPPGCSLKIGRHKDNDVVIENLAVSGYHSKIDSAGDGFIYTDLKSKNGSFINEAPVVSHWLKDGDVINIGKHSLTFAYFDSEPLPQDKQTSETEKTMIIDTNEYRSMVKKTDARPSAEAPPQPALETVAQPSLEIVAEPVSEPASVKDKNKKKVRGYLVYLAGGEGTLALRHKVMKIGKDAASDILVKGWKIGKIAATISRTRDGYFFSYVNGFAKPRINNKRASKKPQKLNESDIISIGSIQLQFIGKKQAP
jgi:pSer/pThr/pTyr-binding forkhead associated (FHA) protein